MKVWIATVIAVTALIALDTITGIPAHLFGLDNLSGPFYGFWSGVGSGSPLFATAAIYLRHHNCHVQGCWRLQWKSVPGTNHVTCRKHHPSDAPTAQQVLDEHMAAQG